MWGFCLFVSLFWISMFNDLAAHLFIFFIYFHHFSAELNGLCFYSSMEAFKYNMEIIGWNKIKKLIYPSVNRDIIRGYNHWGPSCASLYFFYISSLLLFINNQCSHSKHMHVAWNWYITKTFPKIIRNFKTLYLYFSSV